MSIVSGLTIVPAYITPEEERDLLEAVDASPWLTDLKRRVQHYGWRYDYRTRRVDESAFLGALPDWAGCIAARLRRDGYAAAIPDQLIVNEYEPGQGIAAHVDCVPCFGDTIASLSLGSGCEMVFSSLYTDEQHAVYLHPGDLLVMQRDARYSWRHEILARKSDEVDGRRITRKRRVSLTYRTVIANRR